MRVGVLGAGQLGQMLGHAGKKLDLDLKFYDPSSEPTTTQIGPTLCRKFDDYPALREFASDLDVLTYEFENVPLPTLESVADLVKIAPSIKALAAAQDRVNEKSLFAALGIPTARFFSSNSADTLRANIAQVGFPCIVKTAQLGYDGKGQFRIKTEEDLLTIPNPDERYIVEQFIPFDRELSIIAVRSNEGAVKFYPLTHNIHRDGILRISNAPARDLTSSIEEKARSMILKLLNELEYVGVLALELFQVGEDLYANEMAPRVHNSGHWTIEGAKTSQFENHMRAISGLPLGPTDALGFSQMINIIGTEPDFNKLTDLTNCHTHMYGKTPRPGRKLGHITICTDSRAETEKIGARVLY